MEVTAVDLEAVMEDSAVDSEVVESEADLEVVLEDSAANSEVAESEAELEDSAADSEVAELVASLEVAESVADLEAADLAELDRSKEKRKQINFFPILWRKYVTKIY